jgi:putative addiction module killer protein
MAVELRFYQTRDGSRPFQQWLLGLRDKQVVARIEARLARLAAGNFGDFKPVGEGVVELRIDWGRGYRVYFARLGQLVVLLLCGGDKRTQQKDIDRAKAYFDDFKTRTAQEKPRGRG